MKWPAFIPVEWSDRVPAPVVPMRVVSFVDDFERHEVTFSLHFTTRGAGFSFPCDSEGSVAVASLSECGQLNWRDATEREWETISVEMYECITRLCRCGSGKESERHYDAQGIYLCSACPKCWPEKRQRYRPCILSGYNQGDVDEPIEPEDS